MDTSFEQAVMKADNIQKLRKQLFPSIQSHQEFIENLAEQEKEEKEAAVLVENRTLDPAIVQARQLLFSYFFKKVSQRLNYKCVNLGPILTAIHSLLKTMKEHPDVESIELDLKQMIGNLETCQPSLPSDDCPNYVRLPAALFYLIYLKHIGKLPANKIDLEGLLTSVAGCLNSHPSEHSSRQPLLLLNVFIAFYTSWKIVSDYIDQKGANLLPGYNGISHLEELFTLSSKLFDFYGKYLALLAPFTVPDDSITYFFVAVYDFLLKQAYFYRGVAINKIESTYKSFVEALLNIDNNETEKIRRFFSTIGAIQLFPEYHDDNCIFVGSYYLLMKTMPRSLDYAQPYLAGLLFLATLKKRPSSSMKETGILINFEAIHDTIGEMATTNLSADVYPSIHSAIQFIVYDLAHANHVSPANYSCDI